MGNELKPVSSRQEIDAFLDKAKTPARVSPNQGRLLFALDATASRERTWGRACELQSEMFLATADIGNLNVQLCYYRGYREFHASPWVDSADALLGQMNAVSCLGGHTQIARVLRHALAQSRQSPLQALVLIGDCCEEPLDPLCELAGELGLHGTRIFSFHEGDDRTGRLLFQQLAKLSGGAFATFDITSADHLRQLLRGAAMYAAGGIKALERHGQDRSEALLQLTRQLRREP